MSKGFLGVLIIIALAMVGLAAVRGKTAPPATAQFSSLAGMVGKPAPNFSLKDQNGKLFSLSGMRGKKVVLFFNEGIGCYPACWDQMNALGTDPKLNNASVVEASIVTDNPADWNRAFQQEPSLKQGTILYDTDTSVSSTYGMVSLASSMHRGAKPGHTYVIIDQKGIVRFTKDDPGMGINNKLLLTQLGKING